MYSSRTVGLCTSATSGRCAVQVLKTLTGTSTAKIGLRPAYVGLQHQLTPTTHRNFSTTSRTQIREFFPAPDAPSIKKTESAWPHPLYSPEQMNSVTVSHRETRDFSDRVALTMVRILRWGLDVASGYRHEKASELAKTDPVAAARKYGMTERKYLIRNIFLESVAGVPGMVAAMLRHLHSMRRMRRDNGWIETLLEESYNERMHLLIFMKMGEPGWFMRLMVLGAQGVFFNAMFIAYLLSPRTAHRFVGYLEEEAVITYTREIEDIDAGKLPMWAKMNAPQIAIDYYKMPDGRTSLRDLLLHVRADEAKHREVNHTLGNLDQKNDPNPFVSKYKDENKPHPSKDIAYLQPKGWEREDVI